MTRDPIRRCLRVEYWPEVDQNAWNRVTSPGHVLSDDLGRGASWRAVTREKVRKGYGRWLSFLMSIGDIDTDKAPADRIVLENVKPYVLLLQDQVETWTVWTYVVSLYLTAKAFEPERDWDWLYRISAKLKGARQASRSKLPKLRPPEQIAAWAYERLDTLQAGSDRRPTTALQYRDALLIALLVNCPMRLRNLVMIRIGQHLNWTGDAYRLDFIPDEVKTDRYLSLPLPAKLTPYLDTWINEWRPVLLKDQEIDALWVGIRGGQIFERGIYQRICRTTEAAFGIAINPHLFRDIAVTSVVDLTPENVGITAPLLGHINPKTTEEHYVHANQIKFGRRYGNSVTTLREQLARELSNPGPQRGDL
jgi:integrase/recombinase XerD